MFYVFSPRSIERENAGLDITFAASYDERF
jgi:hypothetical protein